MNTEFVFGNFLSDDRTSATFAFLLALEGQWTIMSIELCCFYCPCRVSADDLKGKLEAITCSFLSGSFESLFHHDMSCVLELVQARRRTKRVAALLQEFILLLVQLFWILFVCLCAVNHVDETQANLWLLGRVEFSNECVCVCASLRVGYVSMWPGTLCWAELMSSPPGFGPSQRACVASVAAALYIDAAAAG